MERTEFLRMLRNGDVLQIMYRTHLKFGKIKLSPEVFQMHIIMFEQIPAVQYANFQKTTLKHWLNHFNVVILYNKENQIIGYY